MGGCEDREEAQVKAEPRTAKPLAITGVYAGEFPCSNCAAIEATLWVRPDGRFFLRQRFVDDAESSSETAQAPAATYALGHWAWDDIAADLVLHGRGPERRFVFRDEENLQLRAASAIARVLVRDRSEPAFRDRITLHGESALTQTGATFKECQTGLVLPVVDAGAYRQLRHHHRTVNAHQKVALTVVEGHLATDAATTSERLVVDKLISIKPGTGC